MFLQKNNLRCLIMCEDVLINLYDVSTGIQIVDVEEQRVLGVRPDFDSCCEKIEEWCDLNGIDHDCIVIGGDYL